MAARAEERRALAEGTDTEMAIQEVRPAQTRSMRPVVVLAALAGVALLAAGAASLTGRGGATTSHIDALARKDAEAESCDVDTPCATVNDTQKDQCKGEQRVRCCHERVNSTKTRIDCCDADGVPEDVANGAYCRPACDPDRACKDEAAADMAACIARELQRCQENKTCTVNVPGHGVSCHETGCCQDPNLACYEKNNLWAECMASCMPGNRSDDNHAFPGPWTCRVVDGCSANWEGCLQSRCCRPGFKCYAKNPHWAQCRQENSCQEGVHAEDPPEHQTPWACKAIDAGSGALTLESLGQGPESHNADCAAAWAGCLEEKCCNSPAGTNYSCYVKNPHWAQCRAVNNCAKGIHTEDPVEHQTEWACKVITKDDGDLTWEGLGLKNPSKTSGD